VLGSGCGDGLAVHDLQSSRIAALCARYVRCGAIESADRCEASYRYDYNDDAFFEAAVAAGKIRFDATAAKNCFEALAAASCDTTAADSRHEPAACVKMLVGRVAVGGDCYAATECESGVCELTGCPLDTCCPGVCAASVAPAPIGGECRGGVQCVADAYCGSDSRCQALLPRYAACYESRECEPGFACIGASPGGSSGHAGACDTLPQLGQQCRYSQCGEIGARCELPGSNTCVPKAIGATCAYDNDCPIFTPCNQMTHQCEPLPLRGETCQGSCGGTAWCSRSGTCMDPKPTGSPCGENASGAFECASLFCTQDPSGGPSTCTDRALCI
jgi:hypothetical protein